MNTKLINATDTRFNRATVHNVTFAKDLDDLINQGDMMKLIGASRSLYHNNPLVKSAIEKKASYSIGTAFEYRSTSKDVTVKAALTEAVKQWAKICEVSGKTLNDLLWLTSVSIDTDGDNFWLLSESKDGFPVVQLLEAHAIGSRQTGKNDRGALVEEKGVLTDKKTKRPIKYRILGKTEAEDTLILATNIIRIAEPSTSVRGIPLVSSCLNLANDLKQSQDLILTQHLLASSISMVEHNDTGTNEVNLNDSASTDTINVETINNDGGEIRYFKAGSGGNLQFLTSQNPHANWQDYANNLTNLICLALDWPKTFLGSSDSTGVNDRLSIQQAQKACLDRINLLTPFVTRLCNWAIAKMIKNGYLVIDLSDDWYECKFTKSRQITVDFARDSKAILSEYDAGIQNMSGILSEYGIDLEEHLRERYREEALRIKIKQETEQEFGVPINELTARMISQNQFTQSEPAKV